TALQLIQTTMKRTTAARRDLLRGPAESADQFFQSEHRCILLGQDLGVGFIRPSCGRVAPAQGPFTAPTGESESPVPRQKPIQQISSPCVQSATHRAIIGPRAYSGGIAEAGAIERGGRAMAREDHTTVIQGWIDRLRVGDESARAALLD